jgi:hypothetical protein
LSRQDVSRWRHDGGDGFTPQRSLKKTCEQSPEAVQKWGPAEFPKIAKPAKHEGAEVQWGDETR